MRTSPPLKTSRETLNILQNHYPERLGMAVLYNPPIAFEMFFKVGAFFFRDARQGFLLGVSVFGNGGVEMIRVLFGGAFIPVLDRAENKAGECSICSG